MYRFDSCPLTILGYPPITWIKWWLSNPNQSSLSGMPDTNVDDWTKSMEYQKYEMSEVIQWSWRGVRNWPTEYESGLWQPVMEVSQSLRLPMFDRIHANGLSELYQRIQAKIPSYLHWTVPIRKEGYDDALIQGSLWRFSLTYKIRWQCYL
ncbi:hypothetical protein BS47DRAFT_1308149 [Hydnum rufescens UP504]|uniref:Uncharacterized protein n=1 Tax=Hydnum rufescens UP504 TaxID=1448309 RepID=A0A9P6AEI2_9AGAM|nr:hypothetical protein BS47DRAFT_1308149 [Hydnum rufescens UP504]